jgi:hypothetical protein
MLLRRFASVRFDQRHSVTTMLSMTALRRVLIALLPIIALWLAVVWALRDAT